MKQKLLYSILILVGGMCIAQAQVTVGLLDYNANKAFDGYNLHFPHNQGNAYLLNNCGEIVHVWEDAEYRPGNGVDLTENGYLYICKSKGAASNPYIHAGGGGEKIEVRDWDNNLVWEYTLNDSLNRLHHDMAVHPNGNVFAIAWEKKTAAEAIQAGRDPALLDDGELWPDRIIELEPDGAGGATVVWEWNVWDHLIQDFDSTKDNFGDPAAHPELVDINLNGGPADWMHANSLDYNHFLNQLIICVPTFNEIWIIDHSTTTEQAAGHTGGFGGRGGDLMFRWGNPANYRAGDSTDVKLFYPHDAHWADIELNQGNPDFDKIMIFNNRVGADFSSVNTIAPLFDSYSWEYGTTDGTWFPSDFDWTYTRPVPQDMYSTGLSSVQRLMNGNTLIAVGRFGYTFEITPDEEIVWEYKNPLLSGNPVAQGTELAINSNLQFRMHRYSKNYGAFDGRDLIPQGYIELNPDPDYCAFLVNNENVFVVDEVNIFPNPATDRVQIDITENIKAQQVEVFNVTGQRIYSAKINNTTHMLHTENWSQGIYFIYLDSRAAGKVLILNE